MPCYELAYQYGQEESAELAATEEVAALRLVEAAQRGDLPGVLTEIQGNKSAVDALDQWGNSSLHWAAHNGHVEVVRLPMQIVICHPMLAMV